MIILKNKAELITMRDSGKIAALARATAGEMARPGVTTGAIDTKIRQIIKSHGATPSFLGYGGFPGSACVSVNEQVIHGIPSDRELKDGDIVKIDVGAFYKGFHSDCAATFAVGNVSEEAKKLITVTEESFFRGMAKAVPDARLGDISAAVQEWAEANGFSVVREYVGHGVGRDLHEDPSIPNYGTAGRGVRLRSGMTIAIEPMINVGVYEVKVLPDKWTVVTADGKLSAHYENTVAVTDNGPVILTALA
ncbi:MAG: type I methionyl aminopeptidase [Clostridia bacterium]|nr:type I methionyl aminopeptidase [Clostridia bacterium]